MFVCCTVCKPCQLCKSRLYIHINQQKGCSERESQLFVSCVLVTNPCCISAIIFCSFILHLIPVAKQLTFQNFFPSGVPSLYMSFLENEEQPSEKITGQCFSTEMKATCKHSANLEQETKTTKIVNIIPCYDYLFL